MKLKFNYSVFTTEYKATGYRTAEINGEEMIYHSNPYRR
jgi:hypothetical protein